VSQASSIERRSDTISNVNVVAHYGTSVSCLNARDASIAGTALAHQLLTSALVASPNSNVTNTITKAQNEVIKALGYAGTLAVSAGHNTTTSGKTIASLDKILSAALTTIGSAVSSVKQSETDARTASNSSAIEKNFAIIGIDGIDIMAQPA